MSSPSPEGRGGQGVRTAERGTGVRTSNCESKGVKTPEGDRG